MHISLSPFMAWAVRAIMGMRPPESFSFDRMRPAASRPSISGICTSMMMRSKSPVCPSKAATASLPFFAITTVWPLFSSMPATSL